MSGLYVPDVPSMGLRGSGLTPSQGVPVGALLLDLSPLLLDGGFLVLEA